MDIELPVNESQLEEWARVVEFESVFTLVYISLLIALDAYLYKYIDAGAAPHWGYLGFFQHLFKNTCVCYALSQVMV
jgi:hypothetical protein